MFGATPLSDYGQAYLDFLKARREFPDLNHKGTEPQAENYKLSCHTARWVRTEVEREFDRRAGPTPETETIETLRHCRDHWKLSFEHERTNVIRLRKLIFAQHCRDIRAESEDFKGKQCHCEDCQIVIAHDTSLKTT